MLRGNFLIGIGFKGLRFKEGDGIKDDRGIVEDIEDKVTQDVDLSEVSCTIYMFRTKLTWRVREPGLLGWDNPLLAGAKTDRQEVADRHVAAPAIAASHILRVISSDKQERLKVAESIKIPQPHSADKPLKGMSETDKAQFLKDVHEAVYGCILGAFVQGLEIITKASKTQVSGSNRVIPVADEQKWDVSLHDCLLIWRGGCIIQSGQSPLTSLHQGWWTDGISEFLLPLLKPFGPSKPLNLKADIPEVAAELSKTYEALKKIYTTCIQTDAVAPAIGATLEWLKAVGGKNLPTDFEEMELDCEFSFGIALMIDFGHHNYDIKGKAEKGHEKGKYHTEFQST
jgi:6-phosphogluconate dehydrogenase